MKIIVLTPNYPKSTAMMNGYFIHQQVKALNELGVECHVILTHNWFPPLGLHRLHPYWRQGFTKNKDCLSGFEGIPIQRVPVFVKMPSRFFRDDPYQREAKAIIRYIMNQKNLRNADCIYANFLSDYGYIGTIVAKHLGMKLVAIARGDDVHEWPERNFKLVHNLRQVFSKADLILSTSSKLGQDAKKWFEDGFNREIFTVYNGVDFDRFYPVANQDVKVLLRKEMNLPVGDKLLLCVATPVILKGWIELFDALAKIGTSFQGWKLIAVTPPRRNSDELDLYMIAKEYGVENSFIWLGSVNPEKMPDCYRAMDAFVLPSHNEGLSNAVLEAMASGLVVIATDVGGHREFIMDNENGLLVPPRDPHRLAETLKRILCDNVLQKQLASKAVEGASGIGSYKRNASKFVALMKEYLSLD